MADFAGTLQSMPAEEFEQHRMAVVLAKQQKDCSVADEAERFWEQVSSRRCTMAVSDRLLLCNLSWAELVASVQASAASACVRAMATTRLTQSCSQVCDASAAAGGAEPAGCRAEAAFRLVRATCAAQR